MAEWFAGIINSVAGTSYTGAQVSSAATTAAQVASAAGTVASTVGQVNAAHAQAGMDREQSRQATEAARIEEEAERRRGARAMAKREATVGAAGLDVGSGTPLELALDDAFQNEMNALDIRRQGKLQRNAYSFRAKQSKASVPGIIFQGIGNLGAQYAMNKRLRNP